MHNLSASFVLGYHGCDWNTGQKLLRNEAFRPSENTYDWLGSGIYFWEANPDRALDCARERIRREGASGVADTEPFVVGAIIDLAFCLDLISSNGSRALQFAYLGLKEDLNEAGDDMPENVGGDDLLLRKLDCMVINYLHQSRKKFDQHPFDTVRAVFTEGEPLYPTAGFRRKTHIQICVRNQDCIKGVFRVPVHHFSQRDR
jgi:hypothetical protein